MSTWTGMSPMPNIYLLRPIPVTKDLGYDCNYGFVVRAEDTAEARTIAALSASLEGADFWLNDELSVIVKLGIMDEGFDEHGPDILMRDYHAG
jgi:hypothetical protein